MRLRRFTVLFFLQRPKGPMGLYQAASWLRGLWRGRTICTRSPLAPSWLS
jgi:hypothetical protein